MVNTEFNKESNMPSIRLSKEDLINLAQLVMEQVPNHKRDQDFTISVRLTNVSIQEHDVFKFLEHQKLPRIINQLSIEAKEWGDGGINKSISVTFYTNFISLKVSGKSDTWVLGTHAKLFGFLSTKKSLFWISKLFWVHVVLNPIGIIVFVVACNALISIYQDGNLGDVNWMRVLPIFVIPLVILLLNRVPYAQIVVKDEESLVRRYYPEISVTLALLALISSILIPYLIKQF